MRTGEIYCIRENEGGELVERYEELRTVKATGEVNRLKENGWEVIEKVKSVDPYSGESVHFVVGMPLKARVRTLERILLEVEALGLGEELLRKYAKKHGADYEKLKKGEDKNDGFSAPALKTEGEKRVLDFFESYREALRKAKSVE